MVGHLRLGARHEEIEGWEGQTRWINVSSGDGDVEDLIDRNLVKATKPEERSAESNARRLTTTRREALSLYRSVLRASRLFEWREVIRQSARQEFEQARFETDPEMVARLLVGGRDALHQALERFASKQEQVMEKDFDPEKKNR
ncbi:hypothetical protein CBR_g51533 [Chara braunii]|uniref:Complex 1 LYR protein domain-containing protein n=1 Tax=Chara braunii TaxID=69332 RepID=A0A388M8M1_CHABU|nr:hypothetical protein CBR_g51533 [Chara braunii]|eukprot:GBG90928.1 hypothetical protein CBR_g51533 [Chara braunii]